MTIEEIEKRFLGHVPQLMDVKGHYAVLMPLVERAGELCVLLEVRAETLNRQPGEVCFPGGRMEPGEGPTECAFRETWEELGIPPAAIRPIARLDELHHQSSQLVHPVLALVETGAAESMAVSADEVKETFFVPLRFFQEHESVVYTYPLKSDVGEDFPYDLIGFGPDYKWRGGTVEVPIWKYEGHAIWGMTARIIRRFVEQMGEGALHSNPPDAGR